MADNDSFIGKYMGNYRLVTRVDSGSYGCVYTGKHRIFTDGSPRSLNCEKCWNDDLGTNYGRA